MLLVLNEVECFCIKYALDAFIVFGNFVRPYAKLIGVMIIIEVSKLGDLVLLQICMTMK